jgi:hypothetical protein
MPGREVEMRGWVAVGLLLVAGAANAYVGPGLGMGVIGAILGVLAAVFLAIVGVVWYPLKRLVKKRPGPERARAVDAERLADRRTREGGRENLQKSET